MFLVALAVLLVLFLQCLENADADADADVDTDTEPEAPLSVNTATAELRTNIANPGRGWYRLVEVDSRSIGTFSETYFRRDNVTVAMVEANLEDFTNTALSQTMLNNIDATLLAVRNAGLMAIFRAAYTFDDSDYRNNIHREPENIQLIVQHIGQLKPVFAKYEGILFNVQAGFLGPWGEWHSSRFSPRKNEPASLEARTKVIDALLDAVPASVSIGLRRPLYIQDYAGTQAVTQAQAFGSSSIARLGFFNDALMSDETDMDTFRSNIGTTQRNNEHTWVSRQTRYTPMMGESNLESPNNDSARALALLNLINMQSLNIEYHPQVLNKWKITSTNGMNDYDYVAMKLGYRFVLKNTQISESAPQGGIMQLDLRLVNDGFGHLLQRKKFEIVLRRGSEVHRAAINEDARFWDKNVPITRSYRFRLPAAIATGDWDVYLGLSSPFGGLADIPAYAVRFSNENVWDSTLGLNKIGSLKVTDGTSGGSGAFVQITP